jgi:hypothetical protein
MNHVAASGSQKSTTTRGERGERRNVTGAEDDAITVCKKLNDAPRELASQ